MIVLKGHRSVVTDGHRAWVEPAGNPGMATGGMGDVLSGVVGALLAIMPSAAEATALAVHAHALAGDLAAQELGTESVLPGSSARPASSTTPGPRPARPCNEDGYEVILVNSNPATIMTDPEFGDRTYIEPLDGRRGRSGSSSGSGPTPAADAGRTDRAQLAVGAGTERGVLESHGVEMIGAERTT